MDGAKWWCQIGRFCVNCFFWSLFPVHICRMEAGNTRWTCYQSITGYTLIQFTLIHSKSNLIHSKTHLHLHSNQPSTFNIQHSCVWTEVGEPGENSRPFCSKATSQTTHHCVHIFTNILENVQFILLHLFSHPFIEFLLTYCVPLSLTNNHTPTMSHVCFKVSEYF